MLGGTSILNYLVYIRGNANDYDDWSRKGNTGWSYEELLPYFKKAESNADISDEYHGHNGPLNVEYNQKRHPLCDLFIEAAVSEGIPFNSDFNGASQDGCGYYQATIRNGRRCSTYKAYLEPILDRPNLFVAKNSLAIRVLVENNRATGVEYLADSREIKIARAECEIILAAGAIGTPHLMMLSGLGSANHLVSKNIKVQADLPGVGQNLEDHLGPGSMSAKIKDPNAVYGKVASSFEEALVEFEGTGGGILATHYLDAGAFFSVDSGEIQPSCQTFLTPGIAEFYRTEGVPDRGRFCMGGYPCRPKSRGSVTLASSNPLDPPIIDPNYLSDPDDLRVMIEHVRWNRSMLNAKPFEEIRDGLATPETDNAEDIATFIRQNASTIWHPTSSCRMGPDEQAVVDPELRVYGVERLSICDASIMPTIVSGNTNAPVIVVAEKGADLIQMRA